MAHQPALLASTDPQPCIVPPRGRTRKRFHAGELTFGESAKTNEMCAFTGFYYPAPDGQALVGDVAIGRTFLAK